MKDQNQLLCIAEKFMISNEVAKPNTAYVVGKIGLQDFLNSNDDPNVKSTVVVMNEVIQQMDTEYFSLFENMTNGNMEDEDVDFIICKCLD